jgi:hypothetical protein
VPSPVYLILNLYATEPHPGWIMKRLAVLVVLTIGLAAGCGGSGPGVPAVAEEAPAADREDPGVMAVLGLPPALTELARERAWLHKRQAGAMLTIKPKSEKDPRFEAAVEIGWSIDYTGPRHPFTILSPGQSVSLPNQTMIHFWHADAEGKAVPFNFTFGYGGEGPQALRQQDAFSVPADGKPVTGDPIVLSWQNLSRHAGRAFERGDVVLVQMEHAPTDRGDSHPRDERRWTLDAWTGRLWSQPAALTCP